MIKSKFKLNKDFCAVLRIFLGWRIFLILISLLAIRLLPFKPRFPYWDSILAHLSPFQAVWQWANFDGPHYITIAEKGYEGTGLIQAFFPLYPLTVRWLNKIVNNFLISGLLISNGSFLLALFYFQKLLKLEKIKNKKSVLLFLLFFPASFYFGAFYSESLFFLLTVLFFLAIFKKKWLSAALFSGLASGARLVGIFLGPALLFEYWRSKNKKQLKSKFYLKSLFLLLVSLSGFLFFCFYLYKEFGDPLFFAKVQSGFGASRQTEKLVLLYQVIWRYFKMIMTMKKSDILFFTIMQEFIFSVLALGLLIWAAFKKMKIPYLIYGFGSFFLPTLTGNFSSMPRYIALIFPLYFVFAQIKKKQVRLLILILFGILLIINTALFVRGFWVA